MVKMTKVKPRWMMQQQQQAHQQKQQQQLKPLIKENRHVMGKNLNNPKTKKIGKQVEDRSMCSLALGSNLNRGKLSQPQHMPYADRGVQISNSHGKMLTNRIIEKSKIWLKAFLRIKLMMRLKLKVKLRSRLSRSSTSQPRQVLYADRTKETANGKKEHPIKSSIKSRRG